MKNLPFDIAVLKTTLALVFLISGCVHNTYKFVTVNNTLVSYRTNVIKVADYSRNGQATIVLIDGRPKQFTSRCEGAGLSPCSPPESLTSTIPSHLKYEIKGLAKSESLTPDPNRLPDIPITVMAATKPPVGAPNGAQEIWLEAQRNFAESVKRGRYVVANGSGHYIHKDRPCLVTEEIKRLF